MDILAELSLEISPTWYDSRVMKKWNEARNMTGSCFRGTFSICTRTSACGAKAYEENQQMHSTSLIQTKRMCEKAKRQVLKKEREN